MLTQVGKFGYITIDPLSPVIKALTEKGIALTDVFEISPLTANGTSVHKVNGDIELIDPLFTDPTWEQLGIFVKIDDDCMVNIAAIGSITPAAANLQSVGYHTLIEAAGGPAKTNSKTEPDVILNRIRQLHKGIGDELWRAFAPSRPAGKRTPFHELPAWQRSSGFTNPLDAPPRLTLWDLAEKQRAEAAAAKGSGPAPE